MAVLLLDTCAIMFMVLGEPMARRAHEMIARAQADRGVAISPASAWEVGTLAAKRRIKFEPDPKTWFRRVVMLPGIEIASLGPDTLLDSWFLPDLAHADPADRMLIATARELDLPLVTRDRIILDYAKAGHVKAITC